MSDVSYKYSNENVLDKISLIIENGDVVSLLGANGVLVKQLL